MGDFSEYWWDSAQRSLLFWDVMRQRGNTYLEHLEKGQPPVLAFSYETVMDGREFDPPVNYALVRIISRRSEARPDRRQAPDKIPADKTEERQHVADRRHKPAIAGLARETVSRPIIIFDPRAGHGPGIGGSKQDSQVGMALDAGHPVYFIIFFITPQPGQTLGDVRDAQIRFVEKVRELHPKAPRPAIIGNCQGGWAAALVGAERPDLVGPMVFNGSPISYWAGVEGVNPLRYSGGLLGGVWINSLLSDLGHGYFDGAHLVANFENLNPANTLWTKPYHVYANVDTEAQRFLNFEKWWGGFFLLTDKEIHQIVDGLFIGNKLERGEFELEAGRQVDLKNNDNPVVVFASFGDNITPPQQAFNWIIKTYGTVEEIKRRGQVILVIGHSRIGHLGIFVSAKIARKQHKGIIGSFDMLNFLPPGLYEMRLEEDPHEPGEFMVRYEEKNMDHILDQDDGLKDEEAFFAVRRVSETMDSIYRACFAPWVRMAVNENVAEALRQLHPLRMQRYLLSDLNPWMVPVKAWAQFISSGERRWPAAADNPFRIWEQSLADFMVSGLNQFRDSRDNAFEDMFKAIYESPGMKLLAGFLALEETQNHRELEELRRRDAARWRKNMEEGEFADAMVRIFLAIGFADKVAGRRGYQATRRVLAQSPRMKAIAAGDLRQIIREQSRILQTDADQAIEALPALFKSVGERQDARAMITLAVEELGRDLDPREQSVRERIQAVLAA